jgi:hypothetical protein
MKKMLTYFILLFITVINICCTQSSNKQDEENVVYEDKYTLKDYITKKFKVYKVKNDTDFVSSLDSIIKTVQNCYMFRNKQVCFTIFITNDKQRIKIDVKLYDYTHNDILCSYSDALFFYKGYAFMFNGIFVDDFFVEINATVERNCIKPIENPFIDDRVYHLFSWTYIYENNELKIIHISECYD